MLKVITGEAGPDLEEALCSALADWRLRARKAASFPRAVVVVPSKEIQRHLRLSIARLRGESFVGVSLVTAQGFARSIVEEDERERAEGAGQAPDPAPQALLEELVRDILRAGERTGEYGGLRGLAETAGGPAALLETLGDLTESCLDAGSVAGPERDDILRLYTAFDERRRRAGIVMHADIVREAASVAGRSGFLRRQTDLFYYGFCDMTGVQAELLASVARVVPVRFFLPLGEGPAHEFTRAFLEEVLAPLADAVEAAPPSHVGRPALEPVLGRLFEPYGGAVTGTSSAGPTARPDGARPRVISVSGTECELEAAANEVLGLVEGEGGHEGLGWGEVAVVARTLEPYIPCIEGVFDERRIPFRSSAHLPAGGFPVTKAVAAMMRVFADGMRRADVIDLVSSPYFARSAVGVSDERCSCWDLLSRQLCIVGGETQWAKLRPIAEGGNTVVRREDEEETRVDAEAARGLWRCVDPLIDANAKFPKEGAWAELAAAFEGAFKKFLRLPEGGASAAEAGLFEGLRRAVRDMHGFAAVSGKTTRARFLQAFARRLDEVNVPLGDDRADAVEVLDAMAARCRSFSAVVLIGMGGGLFPRPVSEDAFLADERRAELARRRRVRLTMKRAGFAEERMLFHHVLAAARKHVTVVHQRSDDDGRPLVPSWYLEELRRVVRSASPGGGGIEAAGDIRVPRLFADRLRRELDSERGTAYLTPREWREWLVIEGVRDAGLLGLVSEDAALLGRALAASRELASPARRLGPRDGITGPLPWFLEKTRAEGLSPSSLERYATCPFAFFAAKALELEEAEEAGEALEPRPADAGTLLHGILEAFFRRLVEAGYFAGRKAELETEALLTEAAEGVFAGAGSRMPTVPALILERVRRELLALARVYVSRELERLEAEGWAPLRFEVTDQACLSDSELFPANVRGLKLHGRIDRLDGRRTRDGLETRVVDYKFRSGGSRKPADNDLARGAVRGQRLQPAVYPLMAGELLKDACSTDVEFHFIAPGWKDGPVVVREFPPDCWSTDLGLQVARSISRIVEGIAEGEWFAAPDKHCAYCRFATICRKSHGPTRYRLAADPRAASLGALAKTDPAGAAPKRKAGKKKSDGKAASVPAKKPAKRSKKAKKASKAKKTGKRKKKGKDGS